MRPDKPSPSVVTFHRVYPDAVPVMRADRSALGTIPAAAHQYCGALCSASAFGWYVFPPTDIRLKWNGVDVFHETDGAWEPLASKHLPGFPGYWNDRCPEELRDMAPPFLSSLFVPGIVQIWSGLLVGTESDWSLLIRPPVNVPHSHLYCSYEGIIETDRYKPAPLFTNIRLLATDVVIEFSRFKPLFQVQPIARRCYTDAIANYECREGLADTDGGMSPRDWDGYRRTIRTSDPADDSHRPGSYAVGARKRSKQEA